MFFSAKSVKTVCFITLTLFCWLSFLFCPRNLGTDQLPSVYQVQWYHLLKTILESSSIESQSTKRLVVDMIRLTTGTKGCGNWIRLKKCYKCHNYNQKKNNKKTLELFCLRLSLYFFLQLFSFFDLLQFSFITTLFLFHGHFSI